MASCDFGLIVKKNGKIIEDIEENFWNESLYGYRICGDDNFMIGIYKDCLKIHTNQNINVNNLGNKYGDMFITEADYYPQTFWFAVSYWSVYPIIKYRYKFTINNIDFDIKRIENDTGVDNWYDVKHLSNRCKNFIRNWVNRRCYKTHTANDLEFN